MTKDEALKLALESLDNSIDTVWNEYLDDWRHGLLTRKLQLDAKLKMAEAHKKAITAIKEALEQPEQDMNYWYFRYHETLNKLNSVLAQPEQNLTCKSTQARLAACWGYVKAQPEQEPAAWYDKIMGMEVSMDVSTGEDDSHHRVYGTVYEVMLEVGGSEVDAILAIEDSRNFTAAPQRQPLTDEQMELLIEDIAEWSRYVEVDTAPQNLEKHVRQVLAAHAKGENT
jgi:hypothetical protein